MNRYHSKTLGREVVHKSEKDTITIPPSESNPKGDVLTKVGSTPKIVVPTGGEKLPPVPAPQKPLPPSTPSK